MVTGFEPTPASGIAAVRVPVGEIGFAVRELALEVILRLEWPPSRLEAEAEA